MSSDLSEEKRERNKIVQFPIRLKSKLRVSHYFKRMQALMEILVMNEEIDRRTRFLIRELGDGGHIEVGRHTAYVHNGKLIIR